MYSYGYPRSYNPYSYAQSPYESPYNEAILRDRARALAEQRARRAQYLPHEMGDYHSDEEMEYNQLGSQQRAYLEALRKQQILERMRRERELEELARREEIARQKAAEDQRWQAALEQRQREDEEVRRKLLERRKREIQLKREEAARERNLRTEHQQSQQERGRSASRVRGDNTIPINFRQTSSPTKTPSASRKETPPLSPPKPVYTEVHENAASKIQQHYRIHRSFKVLDALASQFQTLKSEFVYPRVIEFQQTGSGEGHISVRANRPPSDFNDASDVETEETPMDVDGSEPKLAYTSVNYALHTYSDAMDKLLMKLDGVESWGEKSVREKRKSLVLEINKESTRLERYWKQTWADHIAEMRKEHVVAEQPNEVVEAAPEFEDVQTMHEPDFDEEPVHVDIHDAKPEDDEWLQVDEEKAKDEAKEEEAKVMPNLSTNDDEEAEQRTSAEVPMTSDL